jgi:FtsH-binding integral membrane protein
MEIFNEINATSVALLTFAVIGVVRIYSALIERDFTTAGKVIVAGFAGALFASYVADVTWFIGMLIGFSASGVITTASYFGRQA